MMLFVLNPVAGKGRTRELAPLIEEICKSNNVEYKIACTTKPGDGTTLARQGTLEGADRIISVGGDGTLNEVVNGIAGSQAALGVIPAGTGNDFIRMITDNKDMRELIEGTLFGEVMSMDLGKCNDKYFINVASVGFDAEVTAATEKAKKIFSGGTAYIAGIFATIFNYRGRKLNIETDSTSFQSNTLLMAVANGRYYGGGMLPAPRAEVNDGYFDICHIENMPKIKIITIFPKYIKGVHEGLREVTFYKGREVRVSAVEDIPINIDGEVLYDRNICFKILPGGINVIVPKGFTP